MAQEPSSQQSANQASATEASPIEAAEPIIAQCRREIAAGWTHVNAARADLDRTRELHERWAEQIRAIAAAMEAATMSEELSHDRPRSEGFVMVPALKRNRNRRRSASG
jgi:hypothetical protein